MESAVTPTQSCGADRHHRRDVPHRIKHPGPGNDDRRAYRQRQREALAVVASPVRTSTRVADWNASTSCDVCRK